VAAVVVTTRRASAGAGLSHASNLVAVAAPRIWAAMKPGASTGRMPENVSVAVRARVTAGLANDVDAVSHPDEGPDDLHDHVAGHLAPCEAALPRIRERDRRVEVRPRDGTERQDERHQDRAGCECVGEERDGDIPARARLMPIA
jgi:hypothetical protein